MVRTQGDSEAFEMATQEPFSYHNHMGAAGKHVSAQSQYEQALLYQQTKKLQRD